MTTIDDLLPTRDPEAARGEILRRSSRLRRGRRMGVGGPILALAVLASALVLADGDSERLRTVPAGPDPAAVVDEPKTGFMGPDPRGTEPSASISPLRKGRAPAAASPSDASSTSAETKGAKDVRPGTDASLTPSTRQGGPRLVFSKNREPWIMNADGSGQRRLLDEPAASPALSPDESSVAFVALGNSEVEHEGVFIVGLDGRGRRLVAAPPKTAVFDVAWSPNGRTLAFVTGSAGVSVNDAHTSPAEIWLVGVDGTGARQLTTGTTPAWSPDGTTIAFTAPQGLWLIDVDGSDRRLLPGSSRDHSDPSWSPDGRRIVYENRSTESIEVVDRDGGNRRTLLTGQAMSPTWSPDGTLIAFRRSDPCTEYAPTAWQCGENRQVWVMAPDGSNARPITSTEYNDHPQFPPPKRGNG